MRLADLGLSEGWARHQIAAAPNLLGVNAAYEVMQERVQHGRLDLMFFDSAGRKAVLVELQRGNVDISHITRLIEYSAAEKATDSSTAYRSILVAEDFSSKAGRLALSLARLGVIELWRMSASLNADQKAELRLSRLKPSSVRKHDPRNFANEWQSKSWYPVATRLFAHLAKHDPSCSPKFNKTFVGVMWNGGTFNSVAVHNSGSSAFRLELKLEQDAKIASVLERTGFEYSFKDGGGARLHYSVRIPHDASEHSVTPLLPLIARAHDRWIKRGTRQA